MRKSIILFLILFCFSIHGQKMVSKTAEWRYMHEVFDVPIASWYVAGVSSVNYQGVDTIINGRRYLLYNSLIFEGLNYYLNEDTVNKKIFFRLPAGPPYILGLVNEQDYLLYDFSKVIGDTVVIFYPSKYLMHHVIDTIYYINLPNGDSLKSFEITVFISDTAANAPKSIYNYTTWYEGIGSQEDLLQPMFGDFLGSENITNLYCYRDSVQGVQYEPFVVFNVDTAINCDFNIPVFANKSQEIHVNISVYPNPFTDVLQLELPEGSAGGIYEIYDSSGKCLLKGVLRSHYNTINTGALSPGIYFFKLQTDHSIFTRKLIKS